MEPDDLLCSRNAQERKGDRLLNLKASRQSRCLTDRSDPTFCRTAPHPFPPVLKPRCNCQRESSTVCELFLFI